MVNLPHFVWPGIKFHCWDFGQKKVFAHWLLCISYWICPLWDRRRCCDFMCGKGIHGISTCHYSKSSKKKQNKVLIKRMSVNQSWLEVSSLATFGFRYSWFLILVGLWISRRKSQTLPNLRLPNSSGVNNLFRCTSLSWFMLTCVD